MDLSLQIGMSHCLNSIMLLHGFLDAIASLETVLSTIRQSYLLKFIDCLLIQTEILSCLS